jgi:hypothetical protein
LRVAQEIGDRVFTANEIVEGVQRKNLEVPARTIRTFVIAMAPEHPSSAHYPYTREHHGYFVYLGKGKFRLKTSKPIDEPEHSLQNKP